MLPFETAWPKSGEKTKTCVQTGSFWALAATAAIAVERVFAQFPILMSSLSF